MIRTQIQLSENQARSIKQLAANLGISMAEIIRRAIDDMIREGYKPSREEIRERALLAGGQFNVEIEDLSTNHDHYLAEAYQD
jgi:hypothetical protein